MLSTTPDTGQSTHPSVSALLARRPPKRAQDEEAQSLQDSCVNLLVRHQNTSDLLLEISCNGGGQDGPQLHTHLQTSVLEDALRRRAALMDVPVELLSVRVVTERIQQLITHTESVLLSDTQRTEVCALLKAARALMSAGIFSAELFWQEYWRTQPLLEVVYLLHTLSVLPLDLLLLRDAAVGPWVAAQLRALCVSMATAKPDERQRQILSTVVCVLLQRAFEDSSHTLSQTCCVILDSMTAWLLDSLCDEDSEASVWLQVFDVSMFSGCVCEDTLRLFFTHTLARVLTHRPVLTVSDAVSQQSQWSFAKSPPLLTALFRKVCVVFSVECVLAQLQQVLDTHEVNWRLVLSCVSHLLVYSAQTQRCLSDLLSALLISAFERFDVEKMVSVLLLARQASLEGPAVAPSYSDWFRLSFGGSSCCHAKSKKSTVFLLKFLTDLVPFEPPQYLKAHVLHPPYAGGKQRALLQEYVTLARTRLRDLQVCVEETSIFQAASGSVSSTECPAQQDVERAVSLFISSSKIPTTVIEASIFRRPYFLSRFLPALLTPRALPVESDARMIFIEALRKADKIPAALYTSYTESCQRETHTRAAGVCDSSDKDHQVVLQEQFIHLRRILTDEATDGDVCAQMSRISLTLKNMCAEEETGSDVITLDPCSPDATHASVANLILQSFCVCLLDASRVRPPNRLGSWPSVFVKALLAHRWLISALGHRLGDLLLHQAEALSPAHVLGLSALLVELHHCRSVCPPAQISPSADTLCVSERVCDALVCSTRAQMHTCLRLCVCVLSYGLCRSVSQSEELQNFIPQRLYKTAQFVMSRLVPESRTHMSEECESDTLSGVCDLRVSDSLSGVCDLRASVRDSAVALWRNERIRSLRRHPQYQLSFSEWITAELHVQRSRDALTDTERQEFQQWAVELLYLPLCEQDGGCGGDTTQACARIITALLDQHTACAGGCSHEHSDSCLPDLLSILQALLYEASVPRPSSTSHFLWDLIESRCSVSPVGPAQELQYEHTLQSVHRLLLLLPARLLLSLTERGEMEPQRLSAHITHTQRRTCAPDALLSFSLTAHFLKAVVSCSVSCDRPAEAVNACLSLFNTQCPLLPLSAVRWWPRLSAVLSAQWKRVIGRAALPNQLQALDDCHSWSRRVCVGLACAAPAAPPWLLAASLHSVLRRSDGDDLTLVLERLDETDMQVPLFLFLYSVIELISALLSEQARVERVRGVCVRLLSRLLERSDWLLLFDPSGSDHSLCVFTSRVISHHALRLLPLAFFSVLCAVDPETLLRCTRCPGFLFCAGVSYRKLSELYLSADSGDGPRPQELLRARGVVMSSVCLSPRDGLTAAQRKQLQADYEHLDPEMAAAFTS